MPEQAGEVPACEARLTVPLRAGVDDPLHGPDQPTRCFYGYFQVFCGGQALLGRRPIRGLGSCTCHTPARATRFLGGGACGNGTRIPHSRVELEAHGELRGGGGMES